MLTAKEKQARYEAIANHLKAALPELPSIAVILGSALGGLVDRLEDPITIPYKEIEGMLAATAPTHAGAFVYGRLEGKKVLLLAGRFHSYEGYDFEVLDLPIRILSLLGIRTVILTNAAGAINEAFAPGDLMLIEDHLKLMGHSPMRGENLDAFGERFFDCSEIYTKRLRILAKEVAQGLGIRLQSGIYAFMPGPNYETPAEIRALKILGADAVGMSTVTEALTAAHCKMEVLGISLCTNKAAGLSDTPLSEEEVTQTGKSSAQNFQALIAGILAAL